MLAFFTTILSSFVITFILGKVIIPYLKKQQFSQIVRQEGPRSHFIKQGTPTMGGVLFLMPLIVNLLILLFFFNIKNNFSFLIFFLILIISFSVIGGLDDYLKIKYKNSGGLPSRYKFILQIICSGSALILLYFNSNFYQPSSILWAIWAIFVIVGSSNAINFTDGIDGLASGIVIFIALGLAILTLYLPLNLGLKIIILSILGSLIGGLIGFLWFNRYPALIFMGDVGSLSLGALLASVALILNREWLFALMAIIPIAEILSVVLQVGSFKLRKARIFKMSPIHHHFELLGYSENEIVIKFWIITVLAVILALLIFFI